MLSYLEAFYDNLEEPQKGCYIALRHIILSMDENITETWKWSTPFFMYKKKTFCYLWTDKKSNEPYIGIVKGHLIDNPLLQLGKRKRIKALYVNPNEDLPVENIQEVLNELIATY